MHPALTDTCTTMVIMVPEAEYQAAAMKAGQEFARQLAARDAALEVAQGKVVEVVKWKVKTQTVYQNAIATNPDCAAWASEPIRCGLPVTPPVIQVCPPIPESLTVDCYTAQAVPTRNGQLLEQWIDYRSCAAEQSIKLKAVAELADCRIQ